MIDQKEEVTEELIEKLPEKLLKRINEFGVDMLATNTATRLGLSISDNLQKGEAKAGFEVVDTKKIINLKELTKKAMGNSDIKELFKNQSMNQVVHKLQHSLLITKYLQSEEYKVTDLDKEATDSEKAEFKKHLDALADKNPAGDIKAQAAK